MLEVTPAAVAVIRRLAERDGMPDVARVRIQRVQELAANRENIGLSFVDEPAETDVAVTEHGGMTVYLADDLGEPLSGAILDTRGEGPEAELELRDREPHAHHAHDHAAHAGHDHAAHGAHQHAAQEEGDHAANAGEPAPGADVDPVLDAGEGLSFSAWARDILGKSHRAATRFNAAARIRLATTPRGVEAILTDEPGAGDREVDVGGARILVERGLTGLVDVEEPHDRLVLRPPGSTPNDRGSH